MDDLKELVERLSEAERAVLQRHSGCTFWTTAPMKFEDLGIGRKTDELPASDERGARVFYRYRLNRGGLALRARLQQGEGG